MRRLKHPLSLWVTHITGLLSGEKECLWAGWFRAHFWYDKKVDESFDSAQWTADHNQLVEKRAAELTAEGWSVTRESENKFTWAGKLGTIEGKPDIVAVRDDKALVSDAKTGKKRDSDWWQVLIYIAALRSRYPGQIVSGEVVYKDISIPVPSWSAEKENLDRIGKLTRILFRDAIPKCTPTAHECRYCDIAECDERWDAQERAEVVATDLF